MNRDIRQRPLKVAIQPLLRQLARQRKHPDQLLREPKHLLKVRIQRPPQLRRLLGPQVLRHAPLPRLGDEALLFVRVVGPEAERLAPEAGAGRGGEVVPALRGGGEVAEDLLLGGGGEGEEGGERGEGVVCRAGRVAAGRRR